MSSDRMKITDHVTAGFTTVKRDRMTDEQIQILIEDLESEVQDDSNILTSRQDLKSLCGDAAKALRQLMK